MFRANYNTEVPSNRWLSLFELEQTAIDNNQLQWLSDYGSMTERLQAHALEPLKVELVSARRQKVSLAERDFLDLTSFEWPYVRQVVMHVDDKPWLVGRTVIPAQTINHKGRALTMLKNRPLGHLLFDGNLEARLFIEVAAITGEHELYPDLAKLMPKLEPLPKRLWARRSMFLYESNPLLVQEVFLPNCPFKLPDTND